MDFKFFRNRIKVSLYSIGIFAFFLLVSLVSLYIVREKILDNSHIMGQQLAARCLTGCHHLLTIHLVLGTAQGDKCNIVIQNASSEDS